MLSKRRVGPPKLRITGVDYPMRGFKPAQKVQETGNRLAGYCERFGVPFEFQAIAQRWDTLKPEDFKIEKDELVIISCLYQSGKLPDESVDVESPRDYFLKLIRTLSYKQWQMRHQRVGFTQVALNQEVVQRARAMVKANYHKDFMVEQDKEWMVQGWKGRILSAVSCWKPS